MKKFAAFDIDGTLIRWQLYHALVDGLVKLRYADDSTGEYIQQSRMKWKNRSHNESFKEYEHDLIEAYEQLLTSVSVEDFNKAVDAVFEEYKDQVYVYTRQLIKDLKQQGYLLFAISGSQIEIVKKIADYYGFDDCSGSIYEQKDGKFTGKVTLPHLNKNKVLEEFAAKHNANFSDSIAVGDSIGDANMMDIVQIPIAFNPEKKLFDYAREKKWKIVIERKNMFYQLECRDGKYELV
jgi:HAD superfamily hydrolase (TIGR01490 family)